jgi:imidazolonepropionase-like amidohydrolase
MRSLLIELFHRRVILGLACILLVPVVLFGQEEKDLAPVTRTYAITNVNIIQAPGRKVEMGTVVMKNGLITAVGKGIAIPPEAVVLKADSMYVYAGFIDGLSHAGVIKPKEENKERPKDPGNPPPAQAGINPQVDVRSFLSPADKTVEDARNLGFTVAQVVPYGNLLPGQSAIVLMGGKSADDMVLAGKSSLYSELTGANNMYPATILGVMAKWRELYRNASIAKANEALYAANRAGLERPSGDRILEAFYPVIDQKMPVLFKAEKIMDVQRVLTLKSDLSFPLMLADVKEGWPMINKIKTSGAKLFLSIDLPEEKKDDKKEKKDDKKDDKKETTTAAAKTPADIEKEALEKRKAEAIANYTSQAAGFQKAGIPFGFSTMAAKTKDIPANLRRMIAAGLSEDAALAALTTSPAQLLGLSDRMGTIDNGKMANLVISDKPYFNEKAKVRYVFVEGILYKMEVVKDTGKKNENGAKVAPGGTWSYTTDTPQGAGTGKLIIKEDRGNYSGTITNSFSGKETEIKSVSLDGSSLTFSFTIDMGGNPMNISVNVSIDGDSFDGTMTVGTYGSFPIKGTKDPKK